MKSSQQGTRSALWSPSSQITFKEKFDILGSVAYLLSCRVFRREDQYRSHICPLNVKLQLAAS